MGGVIQQISAAERSRKSRLITRQLSRSAWWKNSPVICAYISFRQEVDTGGLLTLARQQEKILGLPRISGQELFFHNATGAEVVYKKHPYGVIEPAAETPLLNFTDLSGPVLMIIPGTAFDREGGRLGKGGGFYDRFLAALPPALAYVCLGICFAEQLVGHVPTDYRDVRMDLVLSDAEVLICTKKGRNL